MTIAEIESTLETLAKRHPNLNETLLRTLLTASGWEEKAINEALAVFKVSKNKFVTPNGVTTLSNSSISEVSVPVVQPTDNPPQNIPEIVYYTGEGEEEKIVPTYVEVPPPKEKKEIIKKSLQEEISNKEQKAGIVSSVILIDESKNAPEEIGNQKEEKLQPQQQDIQEQQSLIIEQKQARQPIQQVEIPENLPLRPFETTPHIWPFSKYREVFHGNEQSQQGDLKESVVAPLVQVAQTPQDIVVPKEQHEEHHSSSDIEIKRTNLDGEDEGLIFLTGLSLFVILLLLAYMYSNGRL